MIRWLLDTNVISELRRPSPDSAVLDWVNETPRTSLYTSAVNIAEIRFGISLQAEPLRRQRLQVWLDTEVRGLFEDRILDATEDSILHWRILAYHAGRSKLPAPSADLLIAAIALIHGLPVATRDAVPFVAAGVPVFNPWTGERFNGA